MDAETGKFFHAIDDEVLFLFYRWKIFRQLFVSGKENLALLNQSGSNVFALLQTLMIDDVFLTLSRLTDPEKTRADENVSIKNLLRKIDGDLDNKLREDLRKKLKKLEALSINLRKHRNKRIAHLDLDHAIKVRSLPPVTNGDLEDALDLVKSIMKSVWLALFDVSVWYDPAIAYGCDGEFLLSVLRKAQQNSISSAKTF